MLLQIAIGILVIGTGFVLLKAPSELRMTAIALIAVAAAVGTAGGYLAGSDGTTRFFYAIAGAMGGWIVGAAIYDRKRKQFLADKAGAQPPSGASG